MEKLVNSPAEEFFAGLNADIRSRSSIFLQEQGINVHVLRRFAKNDVSVSTSSLTLLLLFIFLFHPFFFFFFPWLRARFSTRTFWKPSAASWRRYLRTSSKPSSSRPSASLPASASISSSTSATSACSSQPRAIAPSRRCAPPHSRRSPKLVRRWIARHPAGSSRSVDLQKFIAVCDSALDLLTLEKKRLLSGTLKNQLSEWWLQLIKEAVEKFLKEEGYDLDAVPFNCKQPSLT